VRAHTAHHLCFQALLAFLLGREAVGGFLLLCGLALFLGCVEGGPRFLLLGLRLVIKQGRGKKHGEVMPSGAPGRHACMRYWAAVLGAPHLAWRRGQRCFIAARTCAASLSFLARASSSSRFRCCSRLSSSIWLSLATTAARCCLVLGGIAQKGLL